MHAKICKTSHRQLGGVRKDNVNDSVSLFA